MCPSVADDIRVLAQPITFPLSGKVAPNRFLKSAQSEYACDDSDDAEQRGRPTERYARLYQGSWFGFVASLTLTTDGGSARQSGVPTQWV